MERPTPDDNAPPRAGTRVAIVTPRYPPAIGGVELHVEMLARRLAARGLDVEVLTTDPGSPRPRSERRDGVVVRRFPTVARDETFFASPALARTLIRHAREYALIHGHSYHALVAVTAASAAAIRGVPFVLTPHFHGGGHTRARDLLHIPYRPVGTWMARSAASVICVSESERAHIDASLGPGLRSVVVPNGVDPSWVLAAPARFATPGHRIVLSVGRIEAYKGVAGIVRAMAHLPAVYRLVVIGDGPARADAERLADQLGISDRCAFLGRVSTDDLAAWYRSSDAFVTLSTHEAFGLTLLEAAVGGCAVVASDIPPHREVAGYLPPHQVDLVPATSEPGALATAIQHAIARGRPAVGGGPGIPTWDDMADGVLAVYGRVLTRSAR